MMLWLFGIITIVVAGFVPFRYVTATISVPPICFVLPTTQNCAGWRRSRRSPMMTISNGMPSTAQDGGMLPLGITTYLGKGEQAIVRNGCVLVAPANEYHHFYRQAAIFVYTMGVEDEHEDGEYVIRGLILDHPTPFTLKEMIDQESSMEKDNPLGDTLVWRGGDKGGEGVVLLHNLPELGQAPIGNSGLYQGGWKAALEACATGKARPQDFKVFFNYCQFSEAELDSMLYLDTEGDGWTSLEVDSKLVLSDEWTRGGAWARLRNSIRQMA